MKHNDVISIVNDYSWIIADLVDGEHFLNNFKTKSAKDFKVSSFSTVDTALRFNIMNQKIILLFLFDIWSI
jgi:hypothetical protein